MLAVHQERVQEREVRLAAQRILVHHLRPGNPAQPVETFWVDLDLTGAILINLNLIGCRARLATFTRARFIGYTAFSNAQFTDDAWFTETQFTGDAWFDEARFAGEVPAEVGASLWSPPPADAGQQEEDEESSTKQ